MKYEKLQISREMILDYVKKLGYDITSDFINLYEFVIIFGSTGWTLYRPGNVKQGEWSLVDICSEFYDQMTDYMKLDAALSNPGQFAIQENNKIINDILDKLD